MTQRTNNKIWIHGKQTRLSRPFFGSGVLPGLKSRVRRLNCCLQKCRWGKWRVLNIFFVKPECPLLTCQVQSKEPEFKNHILNDTLFFCFVKLCNGFNLSSGRVGHLEALTWSCLFPPYNWNISRSIRPHFQFHSPFSGNTILSTQLTSHWCKTHGKAAALKKDSYNFSAAEKEQGLVKDDNF